jgi:hypothetical protein
MSDIDHEIEVFGKILTGSETTIELARMARKFYLKKKMRIPLAREIGDYGDNITDLTRALVLGEGIKIGLVTDQAVVDGYYAYIKTVLTGYGSPTQILGVLRKTMDGLLTHLIGKYYAAKKAIDAAETEEDINKVDIDDVI